MEHQITKEDKKIAREIKRVLKIDDNFVLGEMGLWPGEKNVIIQLRKKQRDDLADYLVEFEKNYGLKIGDIVPELEIDDNFGEELKEIEQNL